MNIDLAIHRIRIICDVYELSMTVLEWMRYGGIRFSQHKASTRQAAVINKDGHYGFPIDTPSLPVCRLLYAVGEPRM